MIVRQLKLKLNRGEERRLDCWLGTLTGVYNWAIRKIGLDARDGRYYSAFDFKNLLAGHGKKIGIPSHVLQGTLSQAHESWRRCFLKISRRPRLKGVRNRLNSIPFPDPILHPKNNKIMLAGLGLVRFYSQQIPRGSIKCGRLVRRPSGWYLCLWIDAVHTFEVKQTDIAVSVDPGFKTLLTLSNGEKIENPRELRIGEVRIAQASRAKNYRLVSRLQERQANRRRDRNHKISRKLIENYRTIFYSADNFRGMARTHGKSVTEAGLGQLIGMMAYKAVPAARNVVPARSFKTTMTCSTCGAESGPKGLRGLAVRRWTCTVCGTDHDRDVNAARVVFNVGAGCALKESKKDSIDRNPVSHSGV